MVYVLCHTGFAPFPFTQISTWPVLCLSDHSRSSHMGWVRYGWVLLVLIWKDTCHRFSCSNRLFADLSRTTQQTHKTEVEVPNLAVLIKYRDYNKIMFLLFLFRLKTVVLKLTFFSAWKPKKHQPDAILNSMSNILSFWFVVDLTNSIQRLFGQCPLTTPLGNEKNHFWLSTNCFIPLLCNLLVIKYDVMLVVSRYHNNNYCNKGELILGLTIRNCIIRT